MRPVTIGGRGGGYPATAGRSSRRTGGVLPQAQLAARLPVSILLAGRRVARLARAMRSR